MRLASACLAVFIICASSPAFAQTAKLVNTFNDWQVFVHEDGEEKICFAASAPKEMLPKGVNRGSVFIYLTTWQKDGVKNEFSVKIGYTFEPDSVPTATVGSDGFQLYPKEDKAFMRDPAEEKELVAEMRRGITLTLEGLSNRGTETKDTFSLRGVTAALNHVEEVCPQ